MLARCRRPDSSAAQRAADVDVLLSCTVEHLDDELLFVALNGSDFLPANELALRLTTEPDTCWGYPELLQLPLGALARVEVDPEHWQTAAEAKVSLAGFLHSSSAAARVANSQAKGELRGTTPQDEAGRYWYQVPPQGLLALPARCLTVLTSGFCVC